MKLQENHKEFAVKCFAEHIQRSDVTYAFILECEHDLPQPPLAIGNISYVNTPT